MMFPKPEKRKKKRKTKAEAYMTARNHYLQRNPTCEVCHADAATEVHHSAGRIGDLLLNEEYWFATCVPCHRRVHEFPKWAYENGLLLERNKKWDG